MVLVIGCVLPLLLAKVGFTSITLAINCCQASASASFLAGQGVKTWCKTYAHPKCKKKYAVEKAQFTFVAFILHFTLAFATFVRNHVRAVSHCLHLFFLVFSVYHFCFFQTCIFFTCHFCTSQTCILHFHVFALSLHFFQEVDSRHPRTRANRLHKPRKPWWIPACPKYVNPSKSEGSPLHATHGLPRRKKRKHVLFSPQGVLGFVVGQSRKPRYRKWRSTGGFQKSGSPKIDQNSWL